MTDHDSRDTPRRDFSSSFVPRDGSRSRRRDKDGSRPVSKRSFVGSDELPGKRQCIFPQPGSSQQHDGSPPRSTAHASASDHKFNLLHGLIDKMDKCITLGTSPSRRGVVSGVHDMSPDSDDGDGSDVTVN